MHQVRGRIIEGVVAACLAAGFGCVLIAAGHGIGAIAYLLVVGHPQSWGPPMFLGRLGSSSVMVSCLGGTSGGRFLLAALGTIALGVSWCLFVSSTKLPGFTLLTSIPFAIASVAQVWRLVHAFHDVGHGSWKFAIVDILLLTAACAWALVPFALQR